MLSKKRICVAITARPSYSRIRTALLHLKNAKEIDLVILCSGSALLDRYGRVVDLIRGDGFNVIEELYTFVEGNEPINMALTTANTIQQSASVFRSISPDWIVTIADRYETLGTATAAAYLGIPLIHIQGGEITGNIDEKVRHAVTKLSDVHLVANEHARKRLEKMGENPKSVFVTGCPSIDLAQETQAISVTEVQNVVDELGVGVRISLKEDYIVVMQHPETDTYELSYERMTATLEAAAEIGLPMLVFWPNVDAGSDSTSKAIRVFRESARFSLVRYMKNLEGHLFLRLLAQCKCLVGNSSVGIRECSFMGIPVVNIGDRQKGRDRASNVLDTDWERAEIKESIEKQLSAGPYNSSSIYGNGFAGKEIADVIRHLKPTNNKRFYES